MNALVARAARWALKAEPVVTASAVAGVATSALIHFGITPSSTDRDALTSTAGLVIPVAFGFVARLAAWSPHSVEDRVMQEHIAARVARTAGEPS